VLQEDLSHISCAGSLTHHPCRLGQSRGLRSPLPRRLPRLEWSPSILPLSLSRAPNRIRPTRVHPPLSDPSPVFPRAGSQQSNSHRYPDDLREPLREESCTRLFPRRRRAVEKAIDLVSLRVDCMHRTWNFDLSFTSRALIITSAMTLLVRPLSLLWTISPPPLRRHHLVKQTNYPLAGRGRPKKVPSGRLSYSPYLSFSPQSSSFSLLLFGYGDGKGRTNCGRMWKGSL